jgi:subtilase family serine protease
VTSVSRRLLPFSVPLALTAALLASGRTATGAAASAGVARHGGEQAAAGAATVASGPPTTTYCLRHFGHACYSPVQLRRAYHVGAVWRGGHRGRGTTIAIVDSFGSPTIRNDLRHFDAAFGLPKPPSFRIVQPAGPVTKTDGGWALETTLDVEYAHAFAPKARIILAETPTAETEGVHGFPDMMRSERWLLRHTDTTVISQSFDASEATFPSKARLRSLRYAFRAAARRHVTVLAASGDTGVTNFKGNMSTLYDRRMNSWPSTDPLVTSVGGTVLHLDRAGRRTQPDAVWHDYAGAGGGGRSHVFARPHFQDTVTAVVGTRRGTPDISMNAAADSAALIYGSWSGRGDWIPVSGTSAATPLFAGIVALTADVAGHRLGRINSALYRLHGRPTAGIVDVSAGNNSWAGVQGFHAQPRYDLASGWGTVDARTFVPALAAASR